jgi:chemotaxis protein histidine kinase CheA
MSKITIKDTELELDIYDADENERVLSAISKAKDALTGADGQNAADSIRDACHAVFECFNAIFGDGTDRKIFGEKCNLRDAMRAIFQLCDAVQEQRAELEAETQQFVQKYSPNRAARRAKTEKK